MLKQFKPNNKFNIDSMVNKKSTSILMLRNYPEELTIDESEEYPIFFSFDDEMRAIRTAKKIKGQMYTQVDTDTEGPDNVAYLKGHHIVNRTGWYIVVKKSNRHRNTNQKEKNYKKVKE